MNRASLAALLALVSVASPSLVRAADPPAGGGQADPFAPTPDASAADQEAAVLAAPARPNPTAQPAPAGSAPGAQPPGRPAARARGRQVRQAGDEERLAAVNKEEPQGGIAIELSTSGFASGSLQGGLFLGGRLDSGLIVGGFFDYGLLSVASTSGGGVDVTTSKQLLRLGAGVRIPFIHSADRLVDLYGAGDVSFLYQSAEVPATMGSTPMLTMSAAGLSLALGPGLRLWVHDQIAIGYVARLRFSYLSGELGALAAQPIEDETSAAATEIVFDGTFQLLGVF